MRLKTTKECFEEKHLFRNAEKLIRKLYQFHLSKGDSVSIIDEYGKVIKEFKE